VEIREGASLQEPEGAKDEGGDAARGDVEGWPRHPAQPLPPGGAPGRLPLSMGEPEGQDGAAARERRLEEPGHAEKDPCEEQGPRGGRRLALGPRREEEGEYSEHSAERLGLGGVPELELHVGDDGEGRGQEAGRSAPEEALAEADEARAHARQADDLQDADPDLTGPEDRAAQRVDEEDAGRLEVPGVAIRHLPAEDGVRHHGVDALIAPVTEHQDLREEKEDRDDRDPDDESPGPLPVAVSVAVAVAVPVAVPVAVAVAAPRWAHPAIFLHRCHHRLRIERAPPPSGQSRSRPSARAARAAGSPDASRSRTPSRTPRPRGASRANPPGG